MRVVLTTGFGSREVLRLGEAATPQPAEHQVLIRVMATSINRPDLVQREGKYPPPAGDSEILGLEVSGIIEELGASVTGWRAGDRVTSLVGGGGYAEHAVAYASHLIPIPDSMSFEEAACVCESYITAFLNIFMIGEFRDGQTALLHGGGGGVNTAGIQLCRALTPDCKLIVTTSPEKMDRVRELGADQLINFNLALMMVKRQTIIGSVLRSRPASEKGEIVAQFTRRVLPRFADRTIVPRIEKVFPLDQVADAHRMMEEDRHFGKIVLKIGGA